MSESHYAGGAEEESGLSRRSRFLLRKLPFLIVLALTLVGVAYTSMVHQPLVGYWEFVALVTGAVCVFTGWSNAEDRQARLRLAWTQAVHWGAILVAMNIVLLPSVQRMLTAPSTGLAILLVLALGTFLAGIQVSLQICFLGLAMALSVPAIAWLKQSALFIAIIAVAVIGIVLTFWRRR